jgi:hypothetical protein
MVDRSEPLDRRWTTAGPAGGSLIPMGLRRLLLAPVAVAVLGLVGTACQPAPTEQMELTLDVNPSGTFNVLTNVITLTGRVTCTRQADVRLVANYPLTIDGRTRTVHLAPDGHRQGWIGCPGPRGANWATDWQVIEGNADPLPKTPPNPAVITMTGWTATSFPTPPIDYDVETVTQTVTLPRLLCWPGAPSCTTF